MCWHEADERVLAVGIRQDRDALETWERVDGSWQQRSHATSISWRQGFEIAYDSARRVVVLFGGYLNSGGLTNELWEWDGVNWRKRLPQTTPSLVPPGRHSPSLAYDSARGVTVLYGGQVPSSNLGDHWEWDGIDWVQRTNLPVDPGLRAGGKMTFDEVRGVCVMFGGVTTWFRNDVWEFDGMQWRQFLPVVGPPALRAPSVAFDPDAGRTLLFGGNVGGVPNTDIWEWDGAVWQQRAAAINPGERLHPGIAYDRVAQRVVLHGGGYTTDTWSYDRAATAWSRDDYEAARLVSSGLPCFDGNRHTIYWTQLETMLWNHDERSWRRAAPSPATPPISLGVMSFDATRQEAVWFGWRNGLPETWIFDRASEQWQQRQPVNSPSAELGAVMAYDLASNQTVLFGGNRGGFFLNETWLWNGLDWTQVFPATVPPARASAAMSYDFLSNRVVMVGGTSGFVSLGDVWEWDGVDWLQRVMTSAGPGPRSSSSLGGRADGLLFAGGQDAGVVFGDFWALRGNTWTPLDSEGMPVGVPLQTSVDYVRGEMTIFGTTAIVNPPQGLFASGIWIWGQPRASQTAIGSGCAGAAGVPELSVSAAPAFGQPITFTASNTSPGQSTAFLFGSAVDRVDLAGGCRLFVPSPFAFPVVANQANGDAILPAIVPVLPALAGLDLWSQALVFDSSATGYALSNAVQLRLGWQ